MAKKFLLSWHRGSTDKDGKGNIAKGWQASEMHPWIQEDGGHSFESWVKTGHAFSNTTYDDSHRKGENANGCNFLVIDVDGDAELDQFWALPSVRNWCLCTYTSKSHNKKTFSNPEAQHRFRAVFPLGRFIETVELHKGVANMVMETLIAELGENKRYSNQKKQEKREWNDPCGNKLSQPWFGNREAQFRWNDNREVEIPAERISDDLAVIPVAQQPCEATDLDIERVRYCLEHIVPVETGGSYEDIYCPVSWGCKGLGDVIKDDWVEWVKRSDYRSSDPNTYSDAKWDNLPAHDFKRIYGVCKEFLGESWSKKLPDHLKFKAPLSPVSKRRPPKPPAAKTDQPKAEQPKTESTTEKTPIGGQKVTKKISAQNNKTAKSTAVKKPAKAISTAKAGDDDDKNSGEGLRSLKRKIKTYVPSLRLNTLTREIEYIHVDGERRVMEGNSLNLFYIYLAEHFNIVNYKGTITDMVEDIARGNPYCPIKDYLESCRTAEPYDAWDQIGTVLLGNSDPVATATIQRWLIGAVARGFKPGVAMTWMPILVGKQGAGKSMFVRSLVPESLHLELVAGIDQVTREPQLMHQSMLMELPEVDQYFNRKDIEKLRNIITVQVDNQRLPYDKKPINMPRRNVMIGTTNRSQFLIDPAGNRRFVPLVIPDEFEVPFNEIARVRDSIWASAIAAYEAGQRWELLSAEKVALSEYVKQFELEDPWESAIMEFARPYKYVKVRDLMKQLNIDLIKQDRLTTSRATDILTRHGWRYRKVRETHSMDGRKELPKDHNGYSPTNTAWYNPDWDENESKVNNLMRTMPPGLTYDS